MKKIIVLGYGGTSRELAFLLKTNYKTDILGFLDDFSNESSVIGKLSSYSDFNKQSINFCSGLANYKKMQFRKAFLGKINVSKFYNYINPDVLMYEKAIFGKGLIIFPKCIITNNVELGNHCLIYHNCVISHDSTIRDYTIISNGVIISGHVIIGENTYIGSGAVINENIEIGKNCIVASNATVHVDIPDNSIYISKNRILSNYYL